jgi:hypothetical protein
MTAGLMCKIAADAVDTNLTGKGAADRGQRVVRAVQLCGAVKRVRAHI